MEKYIVFNSVQICGKLKYFPTGLEFTGETKTQQNPTGDFVILNILTSNQEV